MTTNLGDDGRLVARVQLDFIRNLVARFVHVDSVALPVVVYQSQYIAIIALLRSVGHVFENVDCDNAERRNWSGEKWRVWKRDPIFREFIEPARNILLKEFRGGLQLRSGAFGGIAVAADPSMPGGVSYLAPFDAHQLRDVLGDPVVPKLRAAIGFWDRCLREAEVFFS